MNTLHRCQWATNQPDIYQVYHDTEWGVPVTDDKKLFEFLILEGAQAGLSWLTILKRREGYRSAFADFNAEAVARFSASDVEQRMLDEGIIRNRLKIEAAVNNARALLSIQEKHGSFARYMWSFTDGKPIQNQFIEQNELPAETDLSRKISKELKNCGMKFVGPTIIYAHMQATGMVNDHLMGCFRYEEVKAMGEKMNIW